MGILKGYIGTIVWGPAPGNQLANLVLKLATANDISIPEWGVTGSQDSRALRPGLKLLGL